MTHLIDRTSPKGQQFIGTCRYCHKTDLPMSAVVEKCPAAPEENQAIIDAMDWGEQSGPETRTNS